MAAELRLGVSFDLVYFRQQLGKLSQIAASEFTAPIKIKLDRRVIDRELNELQRLFARREYRININDSAVEAASLRIDALQNKISTLRNNVKNGIVVKVKYQEEGSFAAGKTGAAGLYEYMRTQGLSGGNAPGAAQAGRRTQFEAAVAKATNAELKNMLQRANVSGRSSLRTGAAMRDRLRQLDDAAMESVLGNLEMRMREPRKVERSFLDKVARAVFWMAGVDPEYLKQQAAQRRALPNVSFPATVPPGPPIGPSSTGRALPPGAIPGALPGTAFGRQRFLPPQIGQDLNKILRNAAFAFVDSLNARISQVNVREIGRPALPPSMIRGLLPSAVGRTPSMYGGPAQVDRGSFIQQRIAEAYARSVARGATVMGEGPSGGVLGAGGSGAAGPYRPFAQPPRGGAIVPYQAPSRGGGGATGPGSHNIVQFGNSIQGVMGSLQTARVPLSGAIRELGAEFGTAVKQVLLFGTAYKALAFITSLPGQAFEAAKGLQTFRNQLDAVTSVTGTFEQSFQFIDTLAQRFNVPLESARQGFVKMFASMQPAGFNQQEIEGLFTGVSQAAAAFGMSSDQVGRVTNAFSQMASKGQIMSEELKGQLGDVLPGALSIFAEAAGMTIPEFSQAMEDGAFKGKAMQEVLNNVAAVFSNKFGPAAQNASKTLQGALNAINNNLLKMYESFGPLVNQMAAVFGPQVTKLIEDVTSVMKVLTGTFTDAADGVDTLSPRAQALYNTIQQLIPTFRDAAKAVVDLGQFFVQLVPIAIQLGNVFLQIASSNIGKAFIAVSISVGILQTAFVGLTRAGVVPAIAAIYRLIGTQLSASLVTWHRQLITATQSMIGFTAAARASRIALIALRTALTGLVVGGILLGLEAIGTMLFKVGDQASKSAAKVRQLKIDLDRMSEARDVSAINERLQVAQAQERAALASLNKIAQQEPGSASLVGPVTNTPLAKAEADYRKAVKERRAAQDALKNAEKLIAQDFDATRKRELTPITPSPEGEDKEKKKERESQVPQLKLRLELAKKLFDIDMQIASARLKNNIALVSELELVRKLTELDYEQKQILLESIPVEEQRLKIAELQFQRQQAILDSQLKLQLDLNNEYIKTQDSLAAIVTSQQQETDYVKEYYKLVLNGVNPSIAKTRIEVAKRFAEEAKSLDTQIEQLQVSISTTEAAISLLSAKQSLSDTEKQQLEYSKTNLSVLKEQLRLRGLLKSELPAAAEQTAALIGEADAPKPLGVIVSEGYSQAKSDFDDLTNSANMLVTAANSIGDAFGKAFTDIATGAQTWKEGLSGAFSSVASMFADMVAQMLAKWAAMQIIGMFLPGGNAPKGQQPGLTAGINQYPLIANANGGVLAGGFQAFASGGVVTGPTLGLVGEGRFNEAVVPLPNGKSIPVDLGGGAGNNISTNIVVNMNNGQSSSQASGRGGQALGRELEGAVRNVILKESRPGGLIYSGR